MSKTSIFSNADAEKTAFKIKNRFPKLFPSVVEQFVILRRERSTDEEVAVLHSAFTTTILAQEKNNSLWRESVTKRGWLVFSLMVMALPMLAWLVIQLGLTQEELKQLATAILGMFVR